MFKSATALQAVDAISENAAVAMPQVATA